MKLTKHVHACVTVTKEDAKIVIDPGTFTPTPHRRWQPPMPC
ncbi:hypothetical protein [Streptomyces sp. NPDC051993]